MRNYDKVYADKLVSAEDAVKIIESGMWIDYGICANKPDALDKALAARMEAEAELTDLNFRGGIALSVPAVTQVTDAKERLTWNSWHSSGIERKLCDQGLAYYHVLRYSEMPKYYRDNIGKVDVAMFQVAPMDRHGYFNFGLSVSHMAAVCEVADKIIVEVNENMPVCMGGQESHIHIDQIDMIVEGGNPQIGELPMPPATEIEEAIAQYVVPEIPDRACLQLGIGGMPNVIGGLIAKSDLKDLGVHTEIYVDAFVDIAEAGKITGRYKANNKGRQVYTFGLGTRKLYDYMDGNPELMAAGVDYVNDIRVLAELDNLMSINNAVEVDLFGQVASETAGFRHISGAGGQLDFVLGAYLSKGGKSFICCSSAVKKETDPWRVA